MPHVPRISPRRGPPAFEGAPGYLGPPWRLGAQETRDPRMTAGAQWVIRGPSGNQGYMNETLIYIFFRVNVLSIVWKKYSGA